MNALLTSRPAASSSPSAPALRSAPYVRGGGLAAVQKLRYEVYCLERQFVDAALFKEGQESDEYDPHAVHFAATTPSGGVVATLRLVLDSPRGFPLEGHADGLLDQRAEVERARTGEISRLIVAADYRSGTIRQPLLLFGLFRPLYDECVPLGRRVQCASPPRPPPPAAPALRALPPPLRRVRAAGPRLPRRRHGGEPRAAAPAPRISVPSPRRSHQLLRRGGALRRHAGVDAGRVREHSRLRADLSDGERAPVPLLPRERGGPRPLRD